MLCYSMSENKAKVLLRRRKSATLRTRRWRRNRIRKLSERQNHRCCYCAGETYLLGAKAAPPKGMTLLQMATLEHVIPKSRGGTNKDDNLVMACNYCNGARGSKNAYTFYEQIKNTAPAERKRRIKRLQEEVKTKKKVKASLRRAKSIVVLIVAWQYYPNEMSKLLSIYQDSESYKANRSLLSMDDTLPNGLSSVYNKMFLGE